MKLPIFAALTLALVTAANAQDQKFLLPGDKAPELKVAKYYQGDPIKKFESGKVYVVEFWATWCGPCVAVMPHMSELSAKLKGKVNFVGVNVWDDEPEQDARITAFVKKMGDKLTYPVAVDTPEMHMTNKWMEASMSEGIPTAFIVNQQGQIAWIGHPMDIEEPLNQVIEKKFDVPAERTKYEAALAEKVEVAKEYEKITAAQTLYAQGRTEEAIKILDDLISTKSKISTEAKSTKLALYATNNPEKAKELITDLVKGEFSDLANVSIFSIEQATEKDGKRDLALFAAEAVLTNLKKEDPILLYYIAPAYSINNDHKKSLSILERALKAFDMSDDYKNEESMKDFRQEIENAIKKEKALIGN
ncbi:MAG: redoxin family protein [Fimbriimonadaceae bacterium]